MKPVVLILLPHYLPGTRYGGPVSTVRNLCEQLGEEFAFHILCSDRDFGSETSYGFPQDEWLPRGQARVRYVPALDGRLLQQVLRDTEPSLLMLNSLFHPGWTLRPLMERRLRPQGWPRVVLAPRGELSPGALSIKRIKKLAWLHLAPLVSMYHGVELLATNPLEETAIRNRFGAGARVRLAPNLAGNLSPQPRGRDKQAGELRLLFLGRISPMKNLDWLLELLASFEAPLQLAVCGAAEDQEYLARCRALAAALPASITVEWLGERRRDELPQLAAGHDALILPTRGENYGHAIVEALQLGLPVLVSNRTPWKQLRERRAGWDLPLEQPAAFADAMRELRAMDHATWSGWSDSARRLGREIATNPQALEANRRLLLGLPA
jgi:glycosyltransferase involved in cell wall biosynthesis